MQDPKPTRRTALKVLALLGVGATGSAGVAAARDRDSRENLQSEDGHPAFEGLYVALLRPQEGVQSQAYGLAVVQERHDGLKFVLNVVNLRNVFMGHIHEDEPLGPIAVWLYDFVTQDQQPQDGQFSGILDAGTITDDVIVEGRADEAESETVDDLLGKIDDGDAFVNLHTEEYPGGAISGRLAPFDPWAVMNSGGGSMPGSYDE